MGTRGDQCGSGRHKRGHALQRVEILPKFLFRAASRTGKISAVLTVKHTSERGSQPVGTLFSTGAATTKIFQIIIDHRHTKFVQIRDILHHSSPRRTRTGAVPLPNQKGLDQNLSGIAHTWKWIFSIFRFAQKTLQRFTCFSCRDFLRLGHAVGLLRGDR